MRSRRFTKVCSETAIRLNVEEVITHSRCRSGETSRRCGSGGRALTFGISPHRPSRILPGGVEMKRRDWCGVGTEETIRCQGPSVGVYWGYQPRGGYRPVARGEWSALKHQQ